MNRMHDEKSTFSFSFAFNSSIGLHVWCTQQHHSKTQPQYSVFHFAVGVSPSRNVSILFTLWCNCVTLPSIRTYPKQMFHSISLPFPLQFSADMSFVVVVFDHYMHNAHCTRSTNTHTCIYFQSSKVCVRNIAHEREMQPAALFANYS